MLWAFGVEHLGLSIWGWAFGVWGWELTMRITPALKAKQTCRVIFVTLAICVLCTGTWFNWRRYFKWLAQNSQNRLSTRQKSTGKFLNKSWFTKRVQASHFCDARNDKFVECRRDPHSMVQGFGVESYVFGVHEVQYSSEFRAHGLRAMVKVYG